MSIEKSPSADQKFLTNSMASFLQIGAIVVMLYWCYTIVSPFQSVIIWSLIISVALYPTFVAMSARLGGRQKLSAAIIVVIGLAVIVVPVWLMTDSAIGGLQSVAAQLEDGTAKVPPPSDDIAEWPVIGGRLYEVWSAAATNLDATIEQFQPQLQSAGQRAVELAQSTIGSVVMFAVAVIVAGVLFMTASGGYEIACNIASNLAGAERGRQFTDLSIVTIRSVAKGVLGIALIQAILSAVGLVIAGIPGAGILAGLVLVLAIVQLPPLIVLGPTAIWYFTVADPLPAIVFFVYATIVSISDTFLKPLLLGRGVETPMLVILIGAIGGAITTGISGLFEGAVILALGYEIFKAWIAPVPDETQADE